MRIAREIIETLKMELRFIRYKNTQLDIISQQKEVNLNIESQMGGFFFNLPNIFDADFSKSFLNVLSMTEDTKSKSNIVSIGKFDTDIKDANFESITQHSNVTIEIFVNFKDIRDKMVNSNEIRINNSLQLIDKSKLYSEQLVLPFIKFKQFEFIFRKLLIKSDLLKAISCSYYIPYDYVEKDKLLNAINALRNKYDISKIKFYAYYKDIPLELSKMVRIAPSKRLFLQFDSEKIKNPSIRKNANLRNLLVFRYGDKFLYYPI